MRRLTGAVSRRGDRQYRPGRSSPCRVLTYSLVAVLAAVAGTTLLSASLAGRYLQERADREIERVRDVSVSPTTAPYAERVPLGPEWMVVRVDRRGRETGRRAGAPGLPSLPRLTADRLDAYARSARPVTVPGGAYRALVVRDTGRGGYRVIARSTADTERAVTRLLRYEAAFGLPLVLAVGAGALGLRRREAQDRRDWERQLRESVATAGHELRNQLTTIAGYTQLAAAAGETDTHRLLRDNALGRATADIQRMASLIDELTLLQRLDLGQPLQWQRVDLAGLCREAVAAARDCHPDHPVRLLIAPGEHTVHGDPQRLHQAVANLLTNARVHTPPGTTTTLGLGTEDGHRVIEVTDDGPGVPPELRPRIFDRFVRGEETTAAGSGLGLSVVAAVAAAHGGTVRLEPSARGAWFRVRLPAAPGERVAPVRAAGLVARLRAGGEV